MSTRTFLDACVLIAGHRGHPPQLRQAVADVLQDQSRIFVASLFLYLEIMPKAVYHGNRLEVEFYRNYFEHVVRLWCDDYEVMMDTARQEAERCGLAALDALHIAAAHLAGCEVLYTLERKEPMHRTSLVKVVGIGVPLSASGDSG